MVAPGAPPASSPLRIKIVDMNCETAEIDHQRRNQTSMWFHGRVGPTGTIRIGGMDGNVFATYPGIAMDWFK
jgi:hypothetical protein